MEKESWNTGGFIILLILPLAILHILTFSIWNYTEHKAKQAIIANPMYISVNLEQLVPETYPEFQYWHGIVASYHSKPKVQDMQDRKRQDKKDE